MKKFRGRAILGGAVAAGAIGVAGFAFTASNTVPATKAGDGTGAVTGYVASSVHYGLNGTDPTQGRLAHVHSRLDADRRLDDQDQGGRQLVHVHQRRRGRHVPDHQPAGERAARSRRSKSSSLTDQPRHVMRAGPQGPALAIIRAS